MREPGHADAMRVLESPFVADSAAVYASSPAAGEQIDRLLQKLHQATRDLALYVAVIESFSSAVFLRGPDDEFRPLNAAARKLADDFGRSLSKRTLAESSTAPLIDVPLQSHPGYSAIVLASRRDGLQHQLDLATRVWDLTPRQALVLSHVADGLSNKEIAVKLDCAEATVEQHLTIIYRKAGAQGRPLILALLWRLSD